MVIILIVVIFSLRQRSLHLGSEELLAVGRAVAPTIFNRLLEILAFLCYDYQGGLIFAESANLLRLTRDVILFESTVTEAFSIENSAEEPFLLAFLLFFLLHDGCSLVLCVCLG